MSHMERVRIHQKKIKKQGIWRWQDKCRHSQQQAALISNDNNDLNEKTRSKGSSVAKVSNEKCRDTLAVVVHSVEILPLFQLATEGQNSAHIWAAMCTHAYANVTYHYYYWKCSCVLIIIIVVLSII